MKSPVSVNIDEIDGLFSKETARNLYRIFQEALTNIAKHANASHVNVQIRREDRDTFISSSKMTGKGLILNEARARDEKLQRIRLDRDGRTG